MIPHSKRALWSVRVVEREGLRLTRARWRGPAARAPAKLALWADLHLSGDPTAEALGFLPDANLAAAVEQTIATAPDIVLVNGDLARDGGLAPDYARLRERLAPLLERLPLAFVAGNHDHRERMLAGLGAEVDPAAEKSLVLIEMPQARLLLLDSLFRTDLVAGFVGREQRRWAVELIKESETPVHVFVHHPLHDDDQALLDAPRLVETLSALPQVQTLFTAHDHAFAENRSGGLRLIAQPAVGMAFDPDGNIGWLEAKLGPEPMELRFRRIDPSARTESQPQAEE